MKIKRMIKKILPDSLVVMIKGLFTMHNNKRMLEKSIGIRPFDRNRYPLGVNLIGDIKAETGLGQSMRILADMLEWNSIPFAVKQIDSPGGLEHSESKWDKKISDEVLYGINLIHINPNIWAETYKNLDIELLHDRYNIAFWLWELEEFPDEWVPCIQTMDEIWTPSEFTSNSIRKKTNKPVNTFLYHIEVEMKEMYDRTYFRLPEDKFLFLVMYDLKSISERKNPGGVIQAFKKAFPPNENNVGLVVKVNHLKYGIELEKIKKELSGYENIYFIEKNLSRKEVESLIKISDVLVSLHRSEGFGLPLAEAMYMGTPVIATNWSANTEFMDEGSACLVDYRLIRLNRNIGPYKKGNVWADADIGQASEYMRKLYASREFYDKIQRNGKEKITGQVGITVIGDRIAALYKQ